MMRAVLLILLLVLIASFYSGCIRNDTVSSDGVLQIAVTIPPMKEMVEVIGGDRVSVTVVVPPGSEPHTFEPGPGQIRRISRSDLFFRVGEGLFPFEDQLVGRLSSQNPHLRIVDLSHGIDLILMDDHHDCGCGHGDGGYDPHIWLSPANGGVMAESIATSLILIDPDGEAFYRENLDGYHEAISGIDARIQEDLADLRIRRFIVTHDAWGYFAREYDLEQIAVHLGGREPTARDIAEIVRIAREDEISIIFVEPQFSQKTAEVIAAEAGAMVVVIDPLAEEYLNNFIHVAEALEEAMR
ncbi:zinc transport system substrate-binding protein [Methanocalculus alkaliphilus]|uniref:metal ABC transporter solute-binding protein, Zn/Mn family n=1 Tax=Methanocalculus alkaliphilus TaxID=768730 RepID=UPI0020A11796|nr:zinc ABC transporter substrate-binding protein [Methanocalculus alkaliphilus]MCP1714322.1 zinc transport system substrate-binding protein [Methanocalculus alkaliphilus]